MCPKLLMINDRIDEFERLEASIFTISQAICLQRLRLEKCSTFRFDHSLAYGSWYDVQIIAYPKSDQEPQRYLRKGIYLKFGKRIMMSKLTDEKYRDHGAEWKCSYCDKANIGSVAICEHCHTNKAQRIITIFSMIPIVGVPFSITDAILRCGKAAQSNETSDQIDASVTTIFAVVDVVTAPFIIGALVKIPAKVTAQTGIKLTAKAIFSEAGKPLLKEVGKELGTKGIVGGIKLSKVAIETVIKKVQK